MGASWCCGVKCWTTFRPTEESLELDVISRLATAGEVMALPHTDFWHPMDTLKDVRELRALWDRGAAPWLFGSRARLGAAAGPRYRHDRPARWLGRSRRACEEIRRRHRDRA